MSRIICFGDYEKEAGFVKMENSVATDKKIRNQPIMRVLRISLEREMGSIFQFMRR